MNDTFLTWFIDKRMKANGHSHFHVEIVRIKTAAPSHLISAVNEYYYLISPSVPDSLVIESDTNLFNEAADFANFELYGIQEFSGGIKITQAVPIDLEFIKVIPYKINPKTKKALPVIPKKVPTNTKKA